MLAGMPLWARGGKIGRVRDFDIARFHRALDEERQRRGLSWTSLADELNASFAHRPDIPPISSSSLSGAAKRGGLNGNIVMTALRWLDLTAESFLPGNAEQSPSGIPDQGPGHLLRWDGPRLFAALDEHRRALGMTWTAAAEAIGLPVSVIKRTAVTDMVGFPAALRLTQWIDRPAAAFVSDVAV